MPFLTQATDALTGETYFREPRTGRQFRRVVGGFAWPFAVQPGCLLILGEERNPPCVVGERRHVHVLAEYRDRDVAALMDMGARLQEDWACRVWVTPCDDPRVILLDDYNDTLRRERRRLIRITEPRAWRADGARLIPFYLGILQQRIVSEKTLHFGTDCTASDEARRLGHGNTTDKVVEHPGAAALFFALAEIDVNPMPEWGGRGKHGGAADPVGGY